MNYGNFKKVIGVLEDGSKTQLSSCVVMYLDENENTIVDGLEELSEQEIIEKTITVGRILENTYKQGDV